MSNRSFLISSWDMADETVRMELLSHAAIPFPANSPIESAKQALANLTEHEWEALKDWLTENHWLSLTA